LFRPSIRTTLEKGAPNPLSGGKRKVRNVGGSSLRGTNYIQGECEEEEVLRQPRFKKKERD